MELLEGLRKYLDFLKYQKNLSPHTLQSYRRDIQHFLNYVKKQGIKTPQGLTLAGFRKYLKFLDNFNYAPSSIIRKYSSLINFFKFLEKKKLMTENLSQHLIPPRKNQHFYSFLSPAEAELLLDQIELDSDSGKREKALIELIYSTGARVNEIENIKMEDISLNRREIKVTGKGNKQRMVYINKKAADSLYQYMAVRNNFLHHKDGYKKNDYLFLNCQGGRLSARSIRDIVKKHLAKAGIMKNITPHGIRHSFASHMLQGGANIREIQELLGHENISTTQIYTHLNIKKLKQDYNNFHPRAK